MSLEHQDAVRCGDVLTYDGRHGVVWRVDAAAATVTLLPIVRHNMPRQRSDVRLEDAELLALGCSGRHMLIRAGHPVVCSLDGCSRTGAAPDGIMARVVTAMHRAAEAARVEASARLGGPD